MNPSLHPNPHVFNHLGFPSGVDNNNNNLPASIHSEKLFNSYSRHLSSSLQDLSLGSFSTRSPHPAPLFQHAYYHSTLHLSSNNNSIANTFNPRQQTHQLLQVQMPFRLQNYDHRSNPASISSPSTQLLWSNHNFTCEPNTPSTSLYTHPEPHALPFINPPLKNPSNSDQSPILMAIQQKSPPSQPPPNPNTPVPTNPDIVIPIPQPRPDVVDPIESSQQPTVLHNRLEKKYGCWMCHKSFDRPSSTFLFDSSLQTAVK